MESGNSRVACFGVFELDSDARELRKKGVRIRLQDQPFRVLETLLERPGEIVTREQLKERLWAEDEFVEFDHGLNTAIQKIRQALGDSATNPRFVETIPRHGYRFIASIESAVAEPQVKPRAPRIGQLALSALAVVVLAVGVYSAGWLGRQPINQSAPLAAPIPLTAYPGREIHPDFSPDGEQLTFTWEGPNRDNWDIYTKRVGEERAERLTDDAAEDFNSVWSLDGRRIAFVRKFDEKSAAVMTMPAIGGPAREVLEIPYEVPFVWAGDNCFRFLTWHPDGRHLVVAMPGGQSGPFELHAVDTDTGNARKILEANSTRGDFDPAISPDGSKLAFRRRGTESSEIHIVGLTDSLDVHGESLRLETEEDPFFPTWMPDGRELIFASRFADSINLWRAPAGGGEAKAFMPRARVWFPAVAATGRLALSFWTVDYDTWELRPATGETKPIISSTFFDVTPQYSPDASRIAFSSTRSGYREIWICDRDGANPMQLTRLESSLTAAPYWSPDGSWITFQHFDGSQWDISVVRASGGEPLNLTDHPAFDRQPTVSRDGRRIYFSSNRSGKRGICSVAPEGGEPVQLTSGGEEYALESVEGQTLFVSDGTSLWSMSTAGGPRTLEIEDFSTSMDWTVGTAGIYFKDRYGAKTINYYDFDSKAVSSVMEVEKYTYVGLSLSHNGDSLLYTQGDPPESDIMLVEDFR